MTTNERYDAGVAVLSKLAPDAVKNLDEGLGGLAPELARFIVEFNFGDVFARPQLDLAEREILTIAVLTALGGTERQVRTHARMALRAGVPPQKIVETVVHCSPYVGFPRVLNAVAAVKEVLADENLLPV